jgi:transcriptional regulator with XRE-family HTH domain
MADLEAYYRERLKSELDKRKRSNPRYSIRAFARAINLDNGYLSKLLSGKVMLSLDLADQITKRLQLSKEERAEFIVSAIEEQKCHALYLLDAELTECDENLHEINLLPKTKD